MNIYDVLGKLHVKATASVERAVEEDLKKEDPPKAEAKSILENKPKRKKKEPANEDTEGDV